jgi:chaperonin GroES
MTSNCQKLIPINDRVIIEPAPQPEKIGSILLPDMAKEKPEHGRVLAAGPGRFEHGARVPMQVAVGDQVVFNFYSAAKVNVDGHELLMLHEHEIMAIIKP